MSPVNLQNVWLESEDGERVNIPKIKDGDHFLAIDTDVVGIKIEPGSFYRIGLQTFDGRLFQSDLEELLLTPEATSIGY